MSRKQVLDQALLDEVIALCIDKARGNTRTGIYQFYLGCAFFLKKDYDRAIYSFISGLNKEPENGRFLIFLAHTYKQAEHWEEAVETYQKALLKHANYADLHFNIGFVHFRKKSLTKAREFFEAALAINPNYSAPKYYLGLLHLEKGEAYLAAEIFKSIIDNHIADQIQGVGITVNLGDIFDDLGLLDRAIEEYEKLVQVKNYADLHFQLGKLYQKRGDGERALDAYRAAIELNPRFRAARDSYWSAGKQLTAPPVPKRKG